MIRFGEVELATSPLVMTPRPTSLALVERAIEHLAGRAGVVVDVGTGSGAIAIAIAKAAPNALIWATDVSAPAVELARLNVRAAGLQDRVRVVRGDLLDPVPHTVDAIVANLPYLPYGERPLHPDLWAEPPDAVFSDGDGLGDVRRLLADARTRLARDGLVALQVRARVLAATAEDLPLLDALFAQRAAA